MDNACVYVGLAGDTDPGRFVSAGLWRSRGDGDWESLSGGFPAPPQVRAILTDSAHPGRVTIGTQDGIWRSDDAGQQWRRLPAPAPGLAVWSLARHPTEPGCIFAGYEPGAVFRSDDNGETWRDLGLNSPYPAITLLPAPAPKRVTGIAVDPARPSDLYVSLEVGGLHRSADGGRHWACMTEGLYLVDDAVDLHGVAVSPSVPRRVTAIGRIGAFRSNDGGEHWQPLDVPLLRPRGTYCRVLAYSPADPNTLFLGVGNDFDGDVGALFISRDDGRRWTEIDLGMRLKSTIFALAFDPRAPERIACAAKYGQVFRSHDGGATWRMSALPPGAGHVFALGIG